MVRRIPANNVDTSQPTPMFRQLTHASVEKTIRGKIALIAAAPQIQNPIQGHVGLTKRSRIAMRNATRITVRVIAQRAGSAGPGIAPAILLASRKEYCPSNYEQ